MYDSRNNCNAIIKTSDNSLIRGCKNTIIPTSVTNIGNSAFDCCSDLTSINISASVTNIGNNAFQFCSGLTSIDIPASVTNIGEYAFYGCSGLISIVVESGNSVYDSRNNCNAIIKTNDNNLLLGCKNTVIPTGVTSIENLAFALCYDLTSINIPARVTNIGEYAFRDCCGLTSIVVENGNNVYDSRNNCNAIIKTNDNNLLLGCKNSIIPTGVTNIGEYAFAYCGGLTSINIPASVTNIGNNAFRGCNDLTSINFSAGVTNIGEYAFAYCRSLTSINIPASVTNIGGYAFEKCSSLTSINIPESVTSIATNTFSESGLTSLNIPASITNIGAWAFYLCDSLDDIYCYGSIPAHNDYAAFSSNTYSNCTLHVPYGTIDAYRTADDWKNFTNIVEFDPTNVEVVSAEGKPAAEQRIYNLGGVRMATPQKGLNIINGKKVVY